MVRNYVKKSRRQSWSEETMRLALEAVIKHGRSIRKAAIEYQIPQATLSRKLSLCRGDPVKEGELIANPKGKCLTTVFNKEQENLLCQYAATLQKQLIPFTGIDIRRIAFQIAEKFQIPHRFKKDAGMAGEDWFRGFSKRNPSMSVNFLSPLFNRNELFSRKKVYTFFDLMEDIIKRHRLEASDIYTCGETVITCTMTSESEVESVDEYTDCEFQKEPRELVTAELCFSASGAYAPLLMIFPRKSKCVTALQEACPGSWVEHDESGQMALPVFVKWLKKFIEFSKASKDSPVLLISDGYQNFLKNLEVLEMALENGVHMLCIPPYCSERLHPMQHNFMKLLSENYASEVSKWSDTHPACDVSIHEVSSLFAAAYTKVSTAEIPINSFRHAGIWPPDRDRFQEDFTPPATCASRKLNTTLDSSLPNDEASISITDEVNEEMDSEDYHDATLTTEPAFTAHEPIVLITPDCNQTFVTNPVQDSSLLHHNAQTNHQHSKQEVAQQPSSGVPQFEISGQAISDNHEQEAEPNSIVIPREAALSEIQLSDLQQLMQSQEQLYFYVSPIKLNLPS